MFSLSLSLSLSLSPSVPAPLAGAAAWARAPRPRRHYASTITKSLQASGSNTWGRATFLKRARTFRLALNPTGRDKKMGAKNVGCQNIILHADGDVAGSCGGDSGGGGGGGGRGADP